MTFYLVFILVFILVRAKVFSFIKIIVKKKIMLCIQIIINNYNYYLYRVVSFDISFFKLIFTLCLIISSYSKMELVK